MPEEQPIFGVNEEEGFGTTPQEGTPAESDPEQQAPPREGEPPALPVDPHEGQPTGGGGDTDPQGEPQRLYAGKFDSPEKLEQSYEELQRKLGQQGNALGQMQQQYNQLVQYIQQTQMQQRQVPPPQQAGPAQQVDPARFIEELESKGPSVIEEMINRAVTERLTQEGEVLGQSLQQVLQPLYAQDAEGQLRQAVQGQMNRSEERRGDFDEYREDVKRIFGEQPQLLQSPMGVETAYLMARNQRGGIAPQTAAMQQVTAAQKRAAQMPSSGTGVARQQQQQISPEDAIKQGIFGAPNAKGVFG